MRCSPSSDTLRTSPQPRPRAPPMPTWTGGPRMESGNRKELHVIPVAINGFGRVGRCAFRAAFERGSDIDWVGINDLADTRTLAHLLRHDSVYGPFPGEVVVEDGALVVDGMRVPLFAEESPDELPWSDI